MNTELQIIPLAKLKLSSTTSQRERRARFDKDALADLAESIKAVGLLAPIVARPGVVKSTPGLNGYRVLGKDYMSPDEAEEAARNTFEIVAGERRYLAAKQAGLVHVPVSVRELTDEQVLEVQLVENLQREDLHELAEAEGYEGLQKLGYTAEAIAEKCGKSKATVYARMKLLALCPEARTAFYGGKLTASVALLVARIPPELQKEALEKILDHGYDGEPMSYREAQAYAHREFTFRLDQAGFPTGDPTLLPAAGACTACPKRSGNQPELFADIKRGDVCTDKLCFRQKRAAHAERKIAEARASGQPIIEGKQAERIAKYGTASLQEGFVRLDAHCHEDPKGRTYKKLLGKSAKPVLLVDPRSGEAIEVIEKKDIAPMLKEQGVSRAGANDDSYAAQQRAREKKQKAEIAYRKALFLKVREASAARSKTLTLAELQEAAITLFDRLDHDSTKRLAKLLGWPTDGTITPPIEINDMNEEQLAQLIRDCVFAPTLYVSAWSDMKDGALEDAAADLGIDAKQVRKEVAAEAKAKKKAPKKGGATKTWKLPSSSKKKAVKKAKAS